MDRTYKGVGHSMTAGTDPETGIVASAVLDAG